MAKKSSLTKSLETAEKVAVRELANARKRIRAQDKISSFEYGILHEETVAEAKKAAGLIDGLLAELAVRNGIFLVLMREREDVEHLVLATVNPESLTLLPNGRWKMYCQRYIVWNDAGHSLLQSMQVKGPEMLEFKTPLHRLLGASKAFIVCGEEAIAKRLLPVKEREGGPRDRFNFFFKLTQDLEYRFRSKPHLERVDEEKERVAGECRMHLDSLKSVLGQLFVHGPKNPHVNFKGDASPMLIQRAHGLRLSMTASMSECRLYGVDTEESREIAAFGNRWIDYFNIWDDKS